MIFLLFHCFPILTFKCPKGRFVASRFIYFLQNNAEGEENKNKTLQRRFYFYLDFQKNSVGSPENQKIKINLALVLQGKIFEGFFFSYMGAAVILVM